MPVRELRCNTKKCVNHAIIYEWFARSMDKPDPKCPECRVQMERLVSTFATPFVGLLSRFNELGKEHFQETPDGGHVAWRVKSSQLVDGGPQRVKIKTHQDQREFCKAEGLIMPDEINRNAEIDSDGKKLCTSGIQGQWQTGMPTEAMRKTGRPWLEVED